MKKLWRFQLLKHMLNRLNQSIMKIYYDKTVLVQMSKEEVELLHRAADRMAWLFKDTSEQEIWDKFYKDSVKMLQDIPF